MHWPYSRRVAVFMRCLHCTDRIFVSLYLSMRKQVVAVIWHKAPFTRYNLLSNWLYNRFDNRLYRVNGVSAGTPSSPQTEGSIALCPHGRAHIGSTWRIRLNLCFLQHTRVHSPNGKSICSAVSVQLTAESPYTLQWDAPFSLKIVPSHGGSGPHIIHGSVGPPTRVLNPNAISIGSAVLAGLTDRPTDHATRSVIIDRIYVRSTGDAV